MSKARQERRSKIKPFIKVVNYNHLMPTRYNIELEDLKSVVSAETFKEVSQREEAKKTAKKWFETRYASGKNRWFFTPLSMFNCPCLLSGLEFLLVGWGMEIGWPLAKGSTDDRYSTRERAQKDWEKELHRFEFWR